MTTHGYEQEQDHDSGEDDANDGGERRLAAIAVVVARWGRQRVATCTASAACARATARPWTGSPSAAVAARSPRRWRRRICRWRARPRTGRVASGRPCPSSPSPSSRGRCRCCRLGPCPIAFGIGARARGAGAANMARHPQPWSERRPPAKPVTGACPDRV